MWPLEKPCNGVNPVLALDSVSRSSPAFLANRLRRSDFVGKNRSGGTPEAARSDRLNDPEAARSDTLNDPEAARSDRLNDQE
jgi:hypothetical protein